MEVVASLSQGRTAAAQCGLFTYKSVPVIFEPPCIIQRLSVFERKILRNFLGPTLILYHNLKTPAEVNRNDIKRVLILGSGHVVLHERTNICLSLMP